jgi:Protein of unknown function (DUF1402)
MTTRRLNDSNDNHLSDGRLARDIPYTGRTPYERSSDAGAEERRLEVMQLIKDHVDDISRAALKYDVPPETIAGAILWEAIENYKPKWLDSAGPGRVHRETAFFLWKDGKVPSGYTPFDIGKPVIAIEYIAAIMHESAENYENIAGVNIRKNVAVLNTLYQGGNSQGRAELLHDKRKADLANNRSLSQPIVPPREMGEYVKKHRGYIRNLLGLTKDIDRADLSRNSNELKFDSQLEKDKIANIRQVDNSEKNSKLTDVEDNRSLAVRRAEAITEKLEEAGISPDSADFKVAFIEVLKNIKHLEFDEKQDIAKAQGINADKTLTTVDQGYQR